MQESRNFHVIFGLYNVTKLKQKTMNLNFLLDLWKHNKGSPLLAPNNVKNHFLGEPPMGIGVGGANIAEKK